MTTFSPTFVRLASIFTALFLMAGTLFWDSWSFAGPLYQFSFWLQPLAFLFAFGCFLNSLVRLLLDSEPKPAAIKIEVEQSNYTQSPNYR